MIGVGTMAVTALSKDEVLDGTETRLTNWAKEPTILELKQDLTDALVHHREQVSTVQGYLHNLNVTGPARPKRIEGRSALQPKHIRKQAEWRYSALTEPFLSSPDIFNVKPVSWEDRKGAIQNKLLLNHQFNTRLKKVDFIDEYVRTGVDEGTIICRTSWVNEEEEYEDDIPEVVFEVKPELAPLHEELAQMKASNPGQYYAEVPEELQQAHEMTLAEGVPYDATVVSYTRGMKTRTIKNHPSVEVCNHENVIIDPTCQGDLSKANFIIFSFESSLSELQKDGKYKNLSNINLSNSSPLSEPDRAEDTTGSFTFKDDARKKLVVYEYWGFRDIDGSGLVSPIVAAWVGNTIIRMENNPYPDQELPFVKVSYLPRRKQIYGEPDGALLEDNQKVIGAVTRGMIDIMARTAAGQTGMRKDMLDAVNRKKYKNGEDYEFNGGVDPRQGVHTHVYPEIPASAHNMIQHFSQESDSLIGVQSFSQGVSGQALGEVAAGVRGALDAASKRELGILRRLSAGLIEIARKFISMNAEFLDEREVIRVTNEKFVEIKRDDLAGRYDLDLSISTAEEDANKVDKLSFMLQTVGPNEDPAVRKMILADICRLQKMPDLAQKLENYEPQPDPFQQQMQQLEIQLKMAEIEEVQARTAEHYANAGLDQAKAITEGAKAQDLQSTADKKNLDFVEQESGVTQERDLQKAREQSRAQAATKLLDFELKQRLQRQKDMRRAKS